MIKNIFITIVLAILTLNANELEWVDEQIQAIKPTRKGVSNATISNLRDPVIIFKKKISKNSTSKPRKNGRKTYTKTKKVIRQNRPVQYSNNFKLSAIFNKSALINNKWYKVGEKIDTYTLKEVNINDIVLSKAGFKTLRLSTYTQNKTLKYRNK